MYESKGCSFFSHSPETREFFVKLGQVDILVEFSTSVDFHQVYSSYIVGRAAFVSPRNGFFSIQNSVGFCIVAELSHLGTEGPHGNLPRKR